MELFIHVYRIVVTTYYHEKLFFNYCVAKKKIDGSTWKKLDFNKYDALLE